MPYRSVDSKESSEAILKKIKCFVLDLDGTFYLGENMLEGSKEFLEELENQSISFKFFTNNSSKNARIYVDKIRKMGYPAKNDMMMISNQVIINYLKENMDGKKIFVLGNDYLKGDFKEAGIELVEEDADVVVVGFDTSLAYSNVLKACDFIRNGADFLQVNPDFNCPIENGFMPDCGSICAMITASTGKKPKCFGKPSPHALQYILKYTGFKESEIAFIGDRLYTDIAIGKDNDSTTILVLTGETKIEDLKDSKVQPSLVFQSLGSLKDVIEEIYK